MVTVSRLFAVAISLTLFAGCASTPASPGGAGRSDKDEFENAEELYAGQPDVVFATEFPVSSAEEAIRRADKAYLDGKMDLALYMYVRAYAFEKDNLYALRRIGRIHEARGSLKLATRAYAAMLNVDPEHAAALEALGLLYLQTKAYPEAEALLERAVASDPLRWRAYNALGVIADMRGDHGYAIMAYDLALRANPGDAKLLNNRGYSYYLVGAYGLANDDFLEAATKGLDRAWVNMGLVLARQGKYAHAVQMMQGQMEAEVAYNDVGYIAMRQGDLDIAAGYFEKALSMSPRYFEAAAANLVELRRLSSERMRVAGVTDSGRDSG